MGGTARQFNKMYAAYKKKFKKPIQQVVRVMPTGFLDEDFVNTFRRLYPDLWEDLNKQYKYWHDRNEALIKSGKKSRYNFRKPHNFILDCSYYHRSTMRKNENSYSVSDEEKKTIEERITASSIQKLSKKEAKIQNILSYIQEIEPKYASEFIATYFRSNDLHVKLEIIRELSKYKSDEIIKFFYKVNACTRNFSLKQEAMKYIQAIGLPFVLRRKKKGKKSYIDNEIVENESSPDILAQRLYVDHLEKIKEFDVFISHNSHDETEIIEFYKILNQEGYVAYIDWVNDKFDLKRQWCNASTAEVLKERIKQSKVFILFLSKSTLQSQWCPWELGYADAIGKKICIFQYDSDINDVPQFYEGYPRVYLEDSIWIKDKNRSEFKEWIES